MYRLSGAVFLLLTGCGSTELTTGTEPEKAPQEYDSMYGSMEGDTETWVWEEAAQQDPVLDTEYEEGPGEAFQDDFTGAYGMTRPDEEVEIRGVTVPEDGSVRFQLTERNEKLELVEVIGEKTTTEDHFSAILPEKNTLYVISAETLDPDGEVTDTFVNKVAIPPQEANAELSVADEPGGPELRLENRGPTTLFFGEQYLVEEAVDGSWETVPGQPFNDIGLSLPPGETYEQELDLEGIGSGEFRITKEFQVHGTEIDERLGVYVSRE